MDKPNELDLAELRHEFRELYKDLGYEGCLQVLYEFLISAETMCKVIQEEQQKELEEGEDF